MFVRSWGVALLCASTVFLGSTFGASADLNVGDRIRFHDGTGSTGGGEFGIKVYPNVAAGDPIKFVTFCVQTSEHIDFHADGFYVTGINTYSVAGNQPLAAETAFLYTKFRAGALPGLNGADNLDMGDSYGGTNAVDEANELQQAIWYFQNQSGGSASSSYVSYANDALTVGDFTDEWVGQGIGNVRIANLVWATTRNGHTAYEKAQDQLVLVPLPPAFFAGAALLTATALPMLRRRVALATA